MTAPDCQVQSVNVGQPSALHIGPRPQVSGIDKRPLPGRVRVSVDGLAGDHVVDTEHHGGPDQAVYIYTHEDYAHWEAELGRSLPPGIFGENLLVRGLESAAMRVGDQLNIGGPGGVRLEVTAPRIPCAKLAAHVGQPTLVKQFVAVGRPGFYTRVLRGGEVGPGDHVQLTPGPTDAPSIRDLFELWYDPAPDLAKLERYLEFPVAVRVRARMQQLTDRHGALSP
ncbi:MOSC domain-containing protein [Deinococcus humi]|uniref:MOSC domain-containing protein YiiM n=1 Tax=Deinococcus humi TaxID=662880 RepID=A0A7W8JS52_9DEIO|nr:MOSC domain-containing protein [Deinococcus humi]MBB5361930.1 MOSC domain-containing protein YiiM [Deinococcus humi]